MAATAARPTPPPPVHSYPLPSPSKKDIALKPNPHPYAIKTTSTGLLTRSNSSGYNVNATHHYYIPTSPNHSRSDSGKGHRASKSLNLVPDSPSRESPRPLPIPPSLESPKRRDGSNGSNGSSGGYVSADETGTAPLPPPRRPRRSSTLPVIPVPSPIVAPAPSVDDLPDNPKLWTPSQLAIYLATALRMTSIGKPGEIEPIGLPALVAKDIAAFVKGARIGGRTFLRLNEEDLEGLGMNKKWRDALLTAARNLRQNVLKGRIWGADGSPATSPSPQSTSPPKLFSNPELNSSSSSIESSASGEDEAASGAALGRSKARRYRNGRVRGMIESYERSGSFSSDGGLEDGEGGPGEERAKLRTWSRQQDVESPSPSRRRPLPVPPSPSGSHSSRLAADEEPTVEALLAELAPGARAWEEMDLAAGVTVKRVPEGQATIQPIQLDAIAEGSIGHKTVTHLGSGRSSGGSSKGKGERRIVTAIFAPSPSAPSSPTKSALKALEASVADGLETFADAGASPVSSPGRQQQKSRPLPPTPADDNAASAPIPEAKLEHAEAQAYSQPDFEREREREAALESMRIERMLEEEILATRALLDTFCVRLEIVEQKVADLEAIESTRAREEEDASVRAALASASAPERGAEASAPATQTQTQIQTQTQTQGASVEIGVQSSAAAAVADAQVQSDSLEFASKHYVDDAGTTTSSSASLVPPAKAKGPPPPADALSSSTGLLQIQSVIPGVVRRLHAPASTFFGTREEDSEDGDEDEDGAGRRQPANVSDLPSYVFLVGLGVCAVVIQVVLRKVVGKGSGLRP